MRKFSIFFLISLTLFSFERMTVALFDITPVDVEPAVAKEFAAYLSSALTASNKFYNVERSEMEKVFKEQSLQMTGCTADACVSELGKLIGAEKVIVGEMIKKNTGFFLSIRVVNVYTGRRELEIPISARSESDFEQIAKTVVEKIGKMVKVEPAIVGFLKGKPVFDAGSELGINLGDELEIYRIKQVVKDPETGKVLYRDIEVIGRVRIVDVKPDASVGKILEKKKDFVEGDYARTIKGGGIDLEPPSISHSPVKEVNFGEDIVINAEITDKSPFTASVYFKPEGKKSYFRVPLHKSEENRYAGRIPKDYIPPEGLVYYIKASDSLGNARSFFNPENKPFKIKVIDNSPPVITHIPIKRAIIRRDVKIEAVVKDNVKVKSVFCYFRRSKGNYTLIPLTKTSGNKYRGIIKGENVKEPFLEYYLEAVDTSGNKSQWHSEKKPLRVAVGKPSSKLPWIIGTTGAAVIVGGIYFLSGGGSSPSDTLSSPPQWP